MARWVYRFNRLTTATLPTMSLADKVVRLTTFCKNMTPNIKAKTGTNDCAREPTVTSD